MTLPVGTGSCASVHTTPAVLLHVTTGVAASVDDFVVLMVGKS